MPDEHQAWDVAEDFVHLRVDLLENVVERLGQNIRLNHLVEIADWQDVFAQGCEQPKHNFVLVHGVAFSIEQVAVQILAESAFVYHLDQ